MVNKISVHLKDALKRAYCIIYYYWHGTCEDWECITERLNRTYSVKINVYFPRNLDDSMLCQIREAANNKITELPSRIKINIGIPANRIYEVTDIPDDCDLIPNPQNYYVVDGAALCPKLFSEKGAVIRRGLDGIPCFVKITEFENAGNMTDTEQQKFIADIEKIPAKYVRGTCHFLGHHPNTEWLDPWVVKNHFVDYEHDAPLLFYNHSDPRSR